MSDASTFARRPRALTEHERRILNWMQEHGHPGYWNEINSLLDQFSEFVGEAGPGGNHCQFTQETLDRIDAQVAEIARSAIDRYDDWRSDGY